MVIGASLVAALVAGVFISLIWAWLVSGVWMVRPMFGVAVCFAIAIWIGLSGIIKWG